MTDKRMTVLGGGAWGTALAAAATRAGNNVTLWAREESTVRAINETKRNTAYLGDIELPDGIVATGDPKAALDGTKLILAVVPAQQMRNALSNLASLIEKEADIVICAKGIERATGKLMSEAVSDILPENPLAALSGPSFAVDVSRGLPTAVTIAANDIERARMLAARLSGPALRCYSSDDLIGVEIGGSLKNVLAIAAGAVDGAGLGASAIAALVTRGFVELRRIGAAFGARPETLMGLSGLGDLILTCGSAQSRNFSYGLALGRGESLEGRPLAEGVPTAGTAAQLAREKGIEAPIVEATAALLDGRITIAGAVKELFSRPLKSEEA
jgi:glycerol-3-phosphate dehydrogenase (NAD(P)+)